MSEWLWKEVCPGARGWSRVTEENEGLGEGEGELMSKRDRVSVWEDEKLWRWVLVMVP